MRKRKTAHSTQTHTHKSIHPSIHPNHNKLLRKLGYHSYYDYAIWYDYIMWFVYISYFFFFSLWLYLNFCRDEPKASWIWASFTVFRPQLIATSLISRISIHFQNELAAKWVMQNLSSFVLLVLFFFSFSSFWSLLKMTDIDCKYVCDFSIWWTVFDRVTLTSLFNFAFSTTATN